MKRFSELKEISGNALDMNLTELEISVSLFLMNGDLELDGIKNNLEYFLENYLNEETTILGKKVISLDNLEEFLLSPNEVSIDIALDYIRESSELDNFQGLFDPENLSFMCESQRDSIVLSQSLDVESPDLAEYLERMSELKIPPQKIKAKIKKKKTSEGLSLVLTLSESSDKEAKRGRNLMAKMRKPVQAGVMALAIFAGSNSFADSGSEALSQASKAAFETEEGQALKDYAKKQAKKIEKMLKASGAEIPAVILGYGAKVAAEGKVCVDGRLLDDGNVRYSLESNFQDVAVQISGDGPDFLDNSKYRLNAGTKEVRFEVGFEF